MIVVDSSVWIDFFRGTAGDPCDKLKELLKSQQVLVGDLIVVETLQGFNVEKEFNNALTLMSMLPAVEIGGFDVAVQAARNYRLLRTLGITVRKTIDSLIATRCILDGLELLHNDRDFDPFVKHLGLKSVL